MAMNPSGEALRAALELDLKKGAPGGEAEVFNDAVRKLLTFRKGGAVFEFAHRQPDQEYWSGVKYYASGSRSRVRLKRTPVAPEAADEVSTPRKRRIASAPGARKRATAVKSAA